MQNTTIGLDIAKSIFHLVKVNPMGRPLVRKQLKRNQVLKYFAKIELCLVVMEACGSANYWARELQKLGHEVKLISPQYVKPFVKGNKNDYNDALAIAEAAQRSTMLSEYGIVINKGMAALQKELPFILEDASNGLSVSARALFGDLLDELRALNERFIRCEKAIKAVNQGNEQCQRLDEVLGIGPITASALYAAAGNGSDFENGRHFSAWLGLVPRQHSTGGKSVLLGISKRGNRYLRTLLIHGARSVLLHSAGKEDSFSCWAQSLLERRGHNRACVAVANKLARICWVIMAKGERFRPAV